MNTYRHSSSCYTRSGSSRHRIPRQCRTGSGAEGTAADRPAAQAETEYRRWVRILRNSSLQGSVRLASVLLRALPEQSQAPTTPPWVLRGTVHSVAASRLHRRCTSVATHLQAGTSRHDRTEVVNHAESQDPRTSRGHPGSRQRPSDRRASRSPAGRQHWQQAMLPLPIIGDGGWRASTAVEY